MKDPCAVCGKNVFPMDKITAGLYLFVVVVVVGQCFCLVYLVVEQTVVDVQASTKFWCLFCWERMWTFFAPCTNVCEQPQTCARSFFALFGVCCRYCWWTIDAVHVLFKPRYDCWFFFRVNSRCNYLSIVRSVY
jgi:hypothetical protein